MGKAKEHPPKAFETLEHQSNELCNLPKQILISLSFLLSPIFKRIIYKPLIRSTKVVVSAKERVPQLKTRSPNAHPPWEGVQPPPRPGFANYRQLWPIMADYPPPPPPAQLRAPLGGSGTFGAVDPPKRRGRSPRARRCSRIFNRCRSERSAAD